MPAKKKINGYIQNNEDKKSKDIRELKIISIAGKVNFEDYRQLLKIKCKVCGKTTDFNKWNYYEENSDGNIECRAQHIQEARCPLCNKSYERLY